MLDGVLAPPPHQILQADAPPIQASATRSTCPYCGVGCGVLATPDGQGGAMISGDPDHPANLGKLCSKGSALGETLALDTRLLHPMLRLASGSYLRTDWNTALDQVATGFRRIVERDATDPAVQEAKLALPYAYSRLDVHGRAAVLYKQAAESFDAELAKLDASIASVARGDFLAALEREEIKQDADWVVHLRRLPGAPETFYLVSLLASHDFQTALQNYLDLTDLRRTLLAAQTSLGAFDDLIAVRANGDVSVSYALTAIVRATFGGQQKLLTYGCRSRDQRRSVGIRSSCRRVFV